MPANIGTQTVTLLFHTAANSLEWNTRYVDIRKTGVYKGGWLSIVDNTTAQISPLVCEVRDADYQVRVTTADVVNITVASATPYIVLRWTYTGSAANDFMALLAVATPIANDIIVGKCTFDGSLHLNGFNYGDTAYPRTNPAVQDLFLKVEETEDSDLRVRIRGGRIQTASGYIAIPDQKSDLFTPPVANSKVYLVYVNTTTGAIFVDSSGTAAVTPAAPVYAGKLVLAEVTLASTDTSIPQSKIRDVRPFISRIIVPDGVTLELNTATGVLQVKAAGITYDKLGSIYDSGWFAVNKSLSYTKIHNLGGTGLNVIVQFAPDSGGSPDLTKITHTTQDLMGDTGRMEVGALVQDITNTQLTIYTGDDYVAYRLALAGITTRYASGWFRVIAQRII